MTQTDVPENRRHLYSAREGEALSPPRLQRHSSHILPLGISVLSFILLFFLGFQPFPPVVAYVWVDGHFGAPFLLRPRENRVSPGLLRHH